MLVFGWSWQCVLGTEWGRLGWMVVLPDHVRRFCKFLLPFWFQGEIQLRISKSTYFQFYDMCLTLKGVARGHLFMISYFLCFVFSAFVESHCCIGYQVVWDHGTHQ